MVERSLVLIKPDGMSKRLVGKVISRYEEKGLQLSAIKLIQVTKTQAETHYGEHAEKPFFPGLISFITSVPIIAMVWEGEGVVEMIRLMNGATNAAKALPGTIRGDFACSFTENVVHASDSPENGEKEISNFFPELG